LTGFEVWERNETPAHESSGRSAAITAGSLNGLTILSKGFIVFKIADLHVKKKLLTAGKKLN